MILLAAALFTLCLFAYVFWPQAGPDPGAQKTRVEYLRERRDVIYDNLRDLNFEYLAGKHPEQDYAEQRASLEDEASVVLREMDTLSR